MVDPERYLRIRLPRPSDGKPHHLVIHWPAGVAYSMSSEPRSNVDLAASVQPDRSTTENRGARHVDSLGSVRSPLDFAGAVTRRLILVVDRARPPPSSLRRPMGLPRSQTLLEVPAVLLPSQRHRQGSSIALRPFVLKKMIQLLRSRSEVCRSTLRSVRTPC